MPATRSSRRPLVEAEARRSIARLSSRARLLGVRTADSGTYAHKSHRTNTRGNACRSSASYRSSSARRRVARSGTGSHSGDRLSAGAAWDRRCCAAASHGSRGRPGSPGDTRGRVRTEATAASTARAKARRSPRGATSRRPAQTVSFGIRSRARLRQRARELKVAAACLDVFGSHEQVAPVAQRQLDRLSEPAEVSSRHRERGGLDAIGPRSPHATPPALPGSVRSARVPRRGPPAPDTPVQAVPGSAA